MTCPNCDCEECYDEWHESLAPPPPPSNWTKAKRWFRRVVLRRKPGISLSAFDAALRDVYAPGLREQINQSMPLMKMIAAQRVDQPSKPGRRIVWQQVDRALRGD